MSVDDDLWFKDSVFYQLHVKSFFDGNDDGIGDFRGLTRRLDYLQDLGVDTLWLLPFYPSPLKDDGYDIADYRSVHGAYGTLADFRRFVRDAHRRGMKVVNELVINHTSDQHPWFQRARLAPLKSAARRYYVWSDTYERYLGTRIIFTDTEKSNWQWDDTAGAYYWHRFFSHQPDLNFANPRVEREMISVMRFWLDLGVDGMRLDAVPYLCEREGTSNENLPETHAVLKRLRAALDHSHPGRLFLAEANQWPEDVLPYFGDGDECHMAFHFPLMPRMFMAIAREDRHPITDIMRQTPEIPANCQWAVFLRNHDELTLEMVTDRERDYLWDTYAKDSRARLNIGIRRRLAPLMDNDRRRMELMNSLLMSMPGTPIVYYGDELGMGDNIFLGDRNGVRTPMQWSDARNGGFSRADPSCLFLPAIMDPVYGYQTVNVEAQSRSPASLLNWMRRLIHVRRSRKTFGRGALRFLYPANRRILAYLREYQGETILCIANLSHSVQGAELDLKEFDGRVPVELRSESALPPIGDLPYFLTLPPYGFYWFLLASDWAAPDWHERRGAAVPELSTLVVGRLADLLGGAARRTMEGETLPRYLPLQRWYGGKGKGAGPAHIESAALLPDNDGGGWLLTTVQAGGALYFLPLAESWGKAGEDFAASGHPAVLARLRSGSRVGALLDGAADDRLILTLVAAMTGERRVEVAGLWIDCFHTRALDGRLRGDETVSRIAAEQSNTSLVIGEAAVLKLIRRPEHSVSVEAEMGAFLTARGFPHSPALLGGVILGDGGREPSLTLALMHAHVANQGDAWSWLTRQLERVFDGAGLLPPVEARAAVAGGDAELSQFAELLGNRTGALHVALGEATGNPDFDPQPVTEADLSSWRHRALAWAEAALEVVAAGLSVEATALARHGTELRRTIGEAIPQRVAAAKCRIHGDYHLGQVLVAGNDVAIIDFEGEPVRPPAERRAKDSPLRDVAGMLRSFDYAVAALLARADAARPGARRAMAPLAAEWLERAGAQFLGSYILATEGLATLPGDAEIFRRLLRFFQLEKACYEICYEAAHRPAWRDVPVRGTLALLGVALDDT